MSNIQKATFPAREENLSFYCPLCGTHNMNSEGEITACNHLLLVHLSIADPTVMYVRAGLAGKFDEGDCWDDLEDILKSNKDIPLMLVLEECAGSPAPSEIQVVYEHRDDE